MRMCKQGLRILVLSTCVCVSRQHLGLITTMKGLNTSIHHSNNDNSDNVVHGVPEGG